MSATLIPLEVHLDVDLLAPAADRARAYAENAKAPATRRAYRSDWSDFEAWCTAAGLSCLPAAPETVAVYIAALAEEHRPATVSRHMAAIAARHKALGYDSPASMRYEAVASVWHGIKRTHGTAQDAKAPVLIENLRQMLRSSRRGVIGIPMLEPDEYNRVFSLQGHGLETLTPESLRQIRLEFAGDRDGLHKRLEFEREWGAALREYKQITGCRETNPMALYHHKVGMYGPPCRSCGKPLRTPDAKMCGACMKPVQD